MFENVKKEIQQEIKEQRAVNIKLAIDELRHLFGLLNTKNGEVYGESYELINKRIDVVLTRLEELTAGIKGS